MRRHLPLVAVGAAFVAGLIFLVLQSEAGSLLLGGWNFVRSVDDHARYFRLKVKLTYKGEPQDFDIVVGCNVHSILYKDNSDTYEAGLVPTVYGRRMRDGKGLVIRPPDACKGQTTANGRVPRNFMPVVIVYDDAATLGFGTAYISDDAYGSPLSLLKFESATVEKATRGDFETFRETRPPNLVTREIYNSVQSKLVVSRMGLKKAWPPFGVTCHAYERFLVPTDHRSELAKYWPADHPAYWSVPDWKLEQNLTPMNKGLRIQRDIGGVPLDPEWELPSHEILADHGVPRQDGTGTITPPATKIYAASYFPASSDLSPDHWREPPADLMEIAQGNTRLVVNRIDIRHGDERGFAYCFVAPISVIDSTLGRKINDFGELIAAVDGEPIVNAPKWWGSNGDNLRVFFERDEFLLVVFEFDLDTVRGDV